MLRAFIIIGGVLIPVLSTLEELTFFDKYSGIATAVIGAIVAGCAAWEGFANYGEIWRKKRRASELLREEGWEFFQRCGDYEKHGDYHQAAFLHFAAAVENMIAKEVGEYLTVFNPSLDQNKAQVAKIMDNIVDLVVEKMKEKIIIAYTNTAEDEGRSNSHIPHNNCRILPTKMSDFFFIVYPPPHQTRMNSNKIKHIINYKITRGFMAY